MDGHNKMKKWNLLSLQIIVDHRSITLSLLRETDRNHHPFLQLLLQICVMGQIYSHKLTQ
jgi:hypothetical protein